MQSPYEAGRVIEIDSTRRHLFDPDFYQCTRQAEVPQTSTWKRWLAARLPQKGSFRIWLLALVLVIVTLLAPIVADITLDLGVVPVAMADDPGQVGVSTDAGHGKGHY